MMGDDQNDCKLDPRAEIIWNIAAAKTTLEVVLQNIINNASASQFSNCKRARDLIDEILNLL